QVYQRAVALQREEVGRIQERHGAELVRARKPEHDAAVRKVADALIDLGRALEAEQAIRYQLEEAGARCTLRPMGVPIVGTRRDRHSRLRKYLQQAAEFGFSVPKVPEILEAEQLEREAVAADNRRRQEAEKRREEEARRRKDERTTQAKAKDK